MIAIEQDEPDMRRILLPTEQFPFETVGHIGYTGAGTIVFFPRRYEPMAKKILILDMVPAEELRLLKDDEKELDDIAMTRIMEVANEKSVMMENNDFQA
jgi:hypothetical protein